jgi:hypothetical protein
VANDEEQRPMARTVIEALTGGRRKSDGAWAFGKTISIVAACLYAAWRLLGTQMAAYDRLVSMVVEQNQRDQQANREALQRLELSNHELSETIRAAFYVSKGADAPKGHR